MNAWPTIFSCGNVQFDCAPSGGREKNNFLQHIFCASSQSDEGDPHFVQSGKIGIGGQTGVEDELVRDDASEVFPVGDKAKYFVRFFSFANIGIGIAESSAISILGKEYQDAWLPAAAHGNIVALDERMLSVVRDGMKIQIERSFCKQGFTNQLLLPGLQQFHVSDMGDSARIF